jgi:hypothetical protein
MSGVHNSLKRTCADETSGAITHSGRTGRLAQALGLTCTATHWSNLVAIQNDGDIVRGLGFVALYAGYLEEQIDNLLVMLQPIESFPEGEQRWPVSRKIDKAKRLVGQLAFEYRDALLVDLVATKQLFCRRNEVVHGRIYADFDRPDTLKSGRPNVPDRTIEAEELYDLANNLEVARSALYRPMIFQLPRAIGGRA